MKKLLGKAVLMFAVATLVVTQAFGTGNKKTVPQNASMPVSKVVVSYATSYVDTIYYNREAGLAGLAFAGHWQDSVSITNVIVRRMVDGKTEGALAGDTLTAFSSKVAVTNDTTLAGTITLAPLCDTYIVYVTYAGSGQGVTSAKATYEFIKQFYSK